MQHELLFKACTYHIIYIQIEFLIWETFKGFLSCFKVGFSRIIKIKLRKQLFVGLDKFIFGIRNQKW